MAEATQEDLRARITIDPAVLVGKPTIRGMRISVEQIVMAVAAGVPQAALQYAADLVAAERVYLVPQPV
jgi:uncharacterized protein (DUF433 family)